MISMHTFHLNHSRDYLIMAAPIKVVLVEDSAVALQIMHRLLDSSPEIEVVGTAQDGAQGLAVIAETLPDVICTDLQMPKMDGLEFTAKVMSDFPRPILVVSNAVHPGDVDNIFNLMSAGALDFFPKPTSGTAMDYEKLQSTLVTKIKVLASKKR
jgi:chemotaxis response regulator CheB